MNKIFLFLLIANFAFGQLTRKTGDVKVEDSKVSDEIKDLQNVLLNNCYCITPEMSDESCKKGNPYTTGDFISPLSFNRLLRRELTLITLNEEGLPTLGNYVSSKLSKEDTRITLNGSFYNVGMPQNSVIRNILSVAVEGGIKNNISNLFSNSSINSNSGITINFSKFSSSSKYTYTQLQCAKLNVLRQRLYDTFNNEVELRKLGPTQKFMDSLNKLLDEKKKIDSLASLNPNDNEIKIKRLTNLNSINALKNEGIKLTDDKEIVEEYKEKLYQLETKDIKWRSYKISWTDFYFNLKGEEYEVFDEKLPLIPTDTQFINHGFQKYVLGVSFNHFRSSDVRSLYKFGFLSKLSFRLENDNSLSSAEKSEIITTKTDTIGLLKREVITKKNVYTEPFEKFTSFVTNYQFTKYLNDKRNNAISLSGEARIRTDKVCEKAPLTNVGISYHFALLNKADLNSYLNFEVFLKFTDIFNSKDKETKFYQRNLLGFKLGVPFKSLFLNSK